MAKTSTRTPGHFCWIELGTTDVAAAKAFYGELFSWHGEDAPAGDAGTYTMWKSKGKELGGCYALTDETRSLGVPPNWLPYVMVEDVDATASRAVSLGAGLLQDPMDVMEIGRMAVLADPGAAPIALWQAKEHLGMETFGQPGSPCWFELATREPAKARAFYADLFGWRPASVSLGSGAPPYTLFEHTGGAAAGLLEMDSAWGRTAPHWITYFAVDDCDAAAQRIERHGGRVHVPPTDAPPGRFAMAHDPQGADFAVIRLDPDYPGSGG